MLFSFKARGPDIQRQVAVGPSKQEFCQNKRSISDGVDAVPSRESGTEIEHARAYACWVALAENSQITAGSTPPDNGAPKLPSYGEKAKPSVFIPAALLCSSLMHVARKRVMAGRINWRRLDDRDRMRRQGVEDVKGKTPIITAPATKPRRRLSKAELREQAAAAFLAWREGQTSKDK